MASFTGILNKVMPWVGAAAGIAEGNPLPLLKQVAQQIGGVTGKKVDATGNSIAQAVAESVANPDQLAKLKEIDNNFQLAMTQAGFQNVEELARVAADDRASARNREIQVHDWTPRILAFIVVGLCFLGEGLYFRFGAPSNASPELIGRILGTLDSALILVLSYYFGSSAGSAAKSDTIEKLTTQK